MRVAGTRYVRNAAALAAMPRFAIPFAARAQFRKPLSRDSNGPEIAAQVRVPCLVLFTLICVAYSLIFAHVLLGTGGGLLTVARARDWRQSRRG